MYWLKPLLMIQTTSPGTLMMGSSIRGPGEQVPLARTVQSCQGFARRDGDPDQREGATLDADAKVSGGRRDSARLIGR